MTTIYLQGRITEDHQLQLIEPIPTTFGPGLVKIAIEPASPSTTPQTSLSKEEVLQRLSAAGHLRAPMPATDKSQNRNVTPVILPDGSPGSEILVDEDRGER